MKSSKNAGLAKRLGGCFVRTQRKIQPGVDHASDNNATESLDVLE
jgi:hypothetical protein